MTLREKVFEVFPQMREALEKYDPNHQPTDPERDLVEIVAQELGASSDRWFQTEEWEDEKAYYLLETNINGILLGREKAYILIYAKNQKLYSVITPWCFHSSYKEPMFEEEKVIEISPEELAKMPIVRAEWSHEFSDYDIWLSAREKGEWGLVWLFHCQEHDKWFILIGTDATVHGPWKKQWHQGVIKLPESHKDCPYEIFKQWEWKVKVEDPLSLIQPPLKYGFSGWMFTVGGLSTVVLLSQKENWEAVLEFSLGKERKAQVGVSFAEGAIKSWFAVDYKRAVEKFETLFEKGEIPPVERPQPLEDRFSHLAKYDNPREALAVLKIS